jgi:anti-anti-sigma regulatory factor
MLATDGFGSVRFQLEGTFDAAEAWRVCEALGRVPPGTPIVVDFRQVRDSHDFAIALLAQNLSQAICSVSLAGLSQHQRRILRYFGVDDSSLSEPGIEMSG